jgi:hypothetical protein
VEALFARAVIQLRLMMHLCGTGSFLRLEIPPRASGEGRDELAWTQADRVWKGKEPDGRIIGSFDNWSKGILGKWGKMNKEPGR